LPAEEQDPIKAEFEERERLGHQERARREHRLHKLGVALLWLASMVISFGVGYTQNRNLGRTAAIVLTSGEVALIFVGFMLFSSNRQRRDHRDE
jgi:hypothetical protein